MTISLLRPRSADDRHSAGGADQTPIDRAMIKLQQALDFQLRAVRNHQEALATLDDRMHRLDASCCRYNKALGGIDMEPLRQNSLKLARIMGDFLDRPDTADKDTKSPHAA